MKFSVLERPLKFAVAALALVFAAGCEKEGKGGKDVTFSASSSVATKAVYGDDAEGYQRIIWESGDEIYIASDKAKTFAGSNVRGYAVTPAEYVGRKHRGKLSLSAGDDSGLRWDDDENGSYTFWSVYPANAANASAVASGYITATIPETTTLGGAVKSPTYPVVSIFDPVRGSYPMAAENKASAGSSNVTLEFYPAFTAFQVTVMNGMDDAITLGECWLTSDSYYLSGTFTTAISNIIGKSVPYSAISAASQSVTVGVNSTINPGEGVTFSIFCLPVDLSDIYFHCSYTDAAGNAVTKKLYLADSGMNPLSFASCQQHRITMSLTGAGEIDFEITDVIRIVLANAFPDLYINVWASHDGYRLQLCYKDKFDEWGANAIVPDEEIQRMVLEVVDVTITDDYGICGTWSAEEMAVFQNLQSMTLDGVSTLQDISFDGNQYFKEFKMESSASTGHVSISNCPAFTTFYGSSQSNGDIEFHNLPNLKDVTVYEGEANSNLDVFTLDNCKNIETLHLNDVGALGVLDLSGCSKLESLVVTNSGSLTDINLTGCTSLTELELDYPTVLESLDISSCKNLETIMINDPQALKSFVARDMANLTSIEVLNPSNTNVIETVELVNLTSLTSLNFEPTYGVMSYTISNCPGITDLEIPGATLMETLNITDMDQLETIHITDATKLTSFSWDKSSLQTLIFDGDQGTTLLESLTLDCPNLTTIQLTNPAKIKTLSLSNLPADISMNSIYPEPVNSWESMACDNLESLSLTNCDGFSEIYLTPAGHLSSMHFDSCANLSAVTLVNNNNCNVWNNPATTTIDAKAVNCPKLTTFTVDCWGTVATYNFN